MNLSQQQSAGKKSWITRRQNKEKAQQEGSTYVETTEAYEPEISLGDDKLRAIQQDYSNWHGKPMTIPEICTKHGISADTFNKYKKLLNWNHEQAPIPDTDFQNKSIEQLTDDLLSQKKQAVKASAESRAFQDMKDNARKWEYFRSTILAHMEEYIKYGWKPNIPKLNLNRPETPHAMVLGAMDLHYGKGAWKDETGATYSRAEARELLMYHTEDVLAKASVFGQPEKIYVPIGNDWFNCDTPRGTTTKGTPQDNDGTQGLILMEGMELATFHIDLVRQFGPVELLFSPGNHDSLTSTALLMYLYAYYKDTPDVVVNKSIKTRNYVKYGNNILAFSHGDDPTANVLARLIPYEAKEYWAECDNPILFTGHLHFERTADMHGVLWNQVPSLSRVDRYHYNKGYTTSRNAIIGYIIDEEYGQVATIASPNKDVTHAGFRMRNKSR